MGLHYIPLLDPVNFFNGASPADASKGRIVGTEDGYATVYDTNTGALSEIIPDQGWNLFYQPIGISASGRVVGNGLTPSGHLRAGTIDLPASSLATKKQLPDLEWLILTVGVLHDGG